jgi:hypothetical protein
LTTTSDGHGPIVIVATICSFFAPATADFVAVGRVVSISGFPSYISYLPLAVTATAGDMRISADHIS